MNGWTALHIAASEGYVQVAELLIRCGVYLNVDPRTDLNRTPLHWACYNGHLDMVELLLEAGADPNARDDDYCTCLHIASQRGEAGIVNMLLLEGADLMALNRSNKLPSYVAANIDCATLLYEFARKKGLDTSHFFERVPFGSVMLRNSRADSVTKLLIKASKPPSNYEIRKL
jgi:ankyrin repeat protein